jgi:hypothetical protein
MLLRRVIEHIKNQNWFAVGLDFLIVVTGVFIGIQVSNWNDDRSLRERERVYLEQLLIDLESDRATGERGVRAADRTDAAAEVLLTLLESDSDAVSVSDAELLVATEFAGYATLPIGNRTTYDEMISTGGLGLLRSPELKRALGEYYSRVTGGRQWDDLVRQEQYAYRAAIRGLSTREQSAWARANIAASAEDLAMAMPPGFDRAEFLARARSRPEIVDSLRAMGQAQERLRGDSRAIVVHAERLAGHIGSELDSR